MRLSPRNLLLQATLNDDATGAVGLLEQMLPYKGVPIRIVNYDSIKFDFSSPQTISCFGLFDVSHRGGELNIQVTIKNGGSGGTVVYEDFITFPQAVLPTTEVFDKGKTFEPVVGDFVEFNFSVSSPEAEEYLTIRRLWIGDVVHVDQPDSHTHLIIDPSIIEESMTGGMFIINRRRYRGLTLTNIRTTDHLYYDESGNNTDLESLADLIAYCGQVREIGIFPSDDYDPFHGRITAVAKAIKLAGIDYNLSLELRQF